MMKHGLLSLFLLIYICAPLAGLAERPSQARAAQTVPADSLAPADSTGTDSLGTDSATFVPLPQRLAKLMDDPIFERTQVGIYVYDLTADSLVFAHGERQCLRPASNMKVVTAIAALDKLGTDYRYRTSLYADRLSADTDSVCSARIHVRGGYDPLLDRDDLRAFAQALKEKKIKRIDGAVRLDLSFKDADRMGWGWCWDDETVPLTPLLYRNRDEFADALRRTLREEGIDWDGTTAEAAVPDGAQLLCTRTHSLDEALLPMMKESDNSVAESLFYQLAAAGGKRRAERKQAAAHISALVRRVGLDPSHYQFADGSGLSLYNYVTAELLGTLLRYAHAHEDIYRHLLPALPIAGEDGTLRNRLKGTPAAGNVRAKTGTVEGVSSLAGFCTTAGGHTLCFAILNQGIRRGATGRNFQDRVCRALCQ